MQASHVELIDVTREVARSITHGLAQLSHAAKAVKAFNDVHEEVLINENTTTALLAAALHVSVSSQELVSADDSNQWHRLLGLEQNMQ